MPLAEGVTQGRVKRDKKTGRVTSSDPVKAANIRKDYARRKRPVTVWRGTVEAQKEAKQRKLPTTQPPRRSLTNISEQDARALRQSDARSRALENLKRTGNVRGDKGLPREIADVLDRAVKGVGRVDILGAVTPAGAGIIRDKMLGAEKPLRININEIDDILKSPQKVGEKVRDSVIKKETDDLIAASSEVGFEQIAREIARGNTDAAKDLRGRFLSPDLRARYARAARANGYTVNDRLDSDKDLALRALSPKRSRVQRFLVDAWADAGTIAASTPVGIVEVGKAGASLARGDVDPAIELAKANYEGVKQVVTNPLESPVSSALIIAAALRGGSGVAGRAVGARNARKGLSGPGGYREPVVLRNIDRSLVDTAAEQITLKKHKGTERDIKRLDREIEALRNRKRPDKESERILRQKLYIRRDLAKRIDRDVKRAKKNVGVQNIDKVVARAREQYFATRGTKGNEHGAFENMLDTVLAQIPKDLHSTAPVLVRGKRDASASQGWRSTSAGKHSKDLIGYLLERRADRKLGEADSATQHVALMADRLPERRPYNPQRPDNKLDRLADAWRYQALNTRLAYLTNNIAGNTALATLAGATPGGVRAMRQAGVRDEAIPETLKNTGHAVNFTDRYEEVFGPRITKATSKGPARILRYPEWIRHANVLTEQWIRDATYLSKAMPKAKRQAYGSVITLGRKTNDDVMKALKKQKKIEEQNPDIVRHVNDFLGEFSHASRKNLALGIPFYRWLGHITKLAFVTMPVKYPGRAAFLANVSQLGQETLAKMNITADYLQGGIPVDTQVDEEGNFSVVQNPTNSWYPFGTIADTLRIDRQGNPDIRASVASQIHPFIQAAWNIGTGEDVQTGLPIKDQYDRPVGPLSGRNIQAEAFGMFPILSSMFPSGGMAPTYTPWAGRNQERYYPRGKETRPTDFDFNKQFPWNTPLGRFAGIRFSKTRTDGPIAEQDFLQAVGQEDNEGARGRMMKEIRKFREIATGHMEKDGNFSYAKLDELTRQNYPGWWELYRGEIKKAEKK